MNIKKLFFIVILLLMSFSLFAKAEAASLNGWAWSSNIGWISFSSANTAAGVGGTYSVNVATSSGIGVFSGYAWSSNLGWLSFNNGDATHPNARVNLNTGSTTGWARFCSGTVNKDCISADRTDGWDGWVELSGTNHLSPNGGGVKFGTTTASGGAASGYAWGSDVVGWVDFSGVYCPGCTNSVVTGSFDYSLSTPADITVAQNDIGTTGIVKTLVSGTTQPIALSVSGLPYGASSGISNDPSSPNPLDTSIITITTNGANVGTSTLTVTGTSNGILNKTTQFRLIVNGGCPNGLPPDPVTGCTGNPPVNGTNPNGVLWINSGVSTTTAKRIRLNQSATLGWSLPSGWTGCSTDTTPPFPLIAGWNDPASLADITTEAANLQRLSNAGEFIMKIICGASSTNPIKLIVVDPNGGER